MGSRHKSRTGTFGGRTAERGGAAQRGSQRLQRVQQRRRQEAQHAATRRRALHARLLPRRLGCTPGVDF